MARQEDEMPEVPADEITTPTADTTLSETAEGDTLASEARSPELTVPAAGEAAPEESAEPPAVGAAPEARPYQPTEDYQEGDRIYHPVWAAVGVVTHRDPREQIFRMAVGRTEERGRCHLIRVQFDKEVPAQGGARQEVTLIADWRGRPLEVGAPPSRGLPEPEALTGAPHAEEEEAVSPRRLAPALPEIPEPDEELDLEGIDDEPDVEQIEPIGI
jgi:hypothetical protein